MLIIIILLLIILIVQLNSNHIEPLVNIPPIKGQKWKRTKCNYYMNETIKDVLNNNKITKTNGNDWDLIMPCLYDDIENEVSKIKPNNKSQRIFIIDDADELCAKDTIWKNVLDYYGRDDAKQLMPLTYILHDQNDIDLFKNEYDFNKIYILKKNIQRQEGLLITRDYNKIINGYKNGYVIVQELLQNPYTINGFKTNMRFYTLIICQNGDISCYVYNDGFMYYTKNKFKKNDLSHDTNVTTGYIDRHIYEINPLTHNDLRVYLDDDKRKLNKAERKYKRMNYTLSILVFNRLYETLKKVMLSIIGRICERSSLKENITFQLFGVDMAFNDKLEAVLIEINKGPDLGAKDKRDYELKKNVCTDMFSIMNIIENKKHNYIKLFDTNGNELIEQVFDTK